MNDSRYTSQTRDILADFLNELAQSPAVDPDLAAGLAQLIEAQTLGDADTVGALLHALHKKRREETEP